MRGTNSVQEYRYCRRRGGKDGIELKEQFCNGCNQWEGELYYCSSGEGRGYTNEMGGLSGLLPPREREAEKQRREIEGQRKKVENTGDIFSGSRNHSTPPFTPFLVPLCPHGSAGLEQRPADMTALFILHFSDSPRLLHYFQGCYSFQIFSVQKSAFVAIPSLTSLSFFPCRSPSFPVKYVKCSLSRWGKGTFIFVFSFS